jgi:hypothetical protein
MQHTTCNIQHVEQRNMSTTWAWRWRDWRFRTSEAEGREAPVPWGETTFNYHEGQRAVVVLQLISPASASCFLFFMLYSMLLVSGFLVLVCTVGGGFVFFYDTDTAHMARTKTQTNPTTGNMDMMRCQLDI